LFTSLCRVLSEHGVWDAGTNMSGLKCAMTGLPVTANGDAIWDDGEWISWDWINQNIADPDDRELLHQYFMNALN